MFSAVRRPSRIALLSLFILSCSIFSFSEPNEFGIKINNFGQINKNYYRGAQPSESDMQDLKKMGVTTVIDLQKDGKDDEADWVRKAGMQFFRIPMKSTVPATEEQTEHFLKLVNDPANWPVYVHCAGGRHRTGEMTAIYRITQNSWTADHAYEEMKQYGYYSFPNHGSLKKYVFKYFDNFQSAGKQKDDLSAPSIVSSPSMQ
jgi:protein tyrosine/serine phosphatase